MSDTSNQLSVRIVSVHCPSSSKKIPTGEHIVFETPTASTILCSLTRYDALVFAAWIVALADRDGEFEKILAEVKK